MLINLKILQKWIIDPTCISEIAALSFHETEISRRHFIISRFDFFVGIFSFFEDAIAYGLAPTILTKVELNRIELPEEYEKILEDKEIGEQIKKKIQELSPDISKPVKHIAFNRMVQKIIKKSLINKEQADFLLGCSKIRNSIHSNGHNDPFTNVELAQLKRIAQENFIIKEEDRHGFMTLHRTVKWAKEIVSIFIEIALKTNWEIIKDNTIKNHLINMDGS